MVFGVFDLLHPGHHSFLNQARSYGDYLYVIVTRDAIVERLKKRRPAQNEQERKRNLEQLPSVFKAVLGDEILGTYQVIKEHVPDIICLGYDQQGLERNIKGTIAVGTIGFIEMVTLEPFMPDVYHTSLLRAQKQKEIDIQ